MRWLAAVLGWARPRIWDWHSISTCFRHATSISRAAVAAGGGHPRPLGLASTQPRCAPRMASACGLVHPGARRARTLLYLHGNGGTSGTVSIRSRCFTGWG